MSTPQPPSGSEVRSVRGIAESLQEGWTRLARQIRDVSELERQRLQDGFYTGAAVVFDIVQLKVSATEDEAEALAILEAVRTELTNYAAPAAAPPGGQGDQADGRRPEPALMNLIEGIQAECNRVRGLVPAYAEIGPAGTFGKLMLEHAIKEGEASIASGDVVRMARALDSLRGCQ